MKFKKFICSVLVLTLILPLYACGDDEKKEVYNEFITLVEEDRFDSALEYFATAYEESSLSSFDDFLMSYKTYKNFSDYYNYADILNQYKNSEYKDLDRTYDDLKEVPSFLNNKEKYIGEIKEIFNNINGTYCCRSEGHNKYLIIIDGEVWWALGEHENSLCTMEFLELDKNTIAPITRWYTLYDYCNSFAPDARVYMTESDKYVISNNPEEGGLVFFTLDGKTKTITSTDNETGIRAGKYVKTDYIIVLEE